MQEGKAASEASNFWGAIFRPRFEGFAMGAIVKSRFEGFALGAIIRPRFGDFVLGALPTQIHFSSSSR